jgi:hypothetical protein
VLISASYRTKLPPRYVLCSDNLNPLWASKVSKSRRAEVVVRVNSQVSNTNGKRTSENSKRDRNLEGTTSSAISRRHPGAISWMQVSST